MPQLPGAKLLPWFDVCTNDDLKTAAHITGRVELGVQPQTADQNMIQRLTTLAPASGANKYNLAATGFGPLRANNLIHVAGIGWDHAVVIRKQDDGSYKIPWLFCHDGTGKQVFGLNPNVPLEPVEQATLRQPHICRQHKNKDCTWSVYRPPDVTVNHVVTFGVSACSLTIAFPDDLDFIFLAHMDSKAPIPIGLLANKVTNFERLGRIRMMASTISERPELLKFKKENAYRYLPQVRPVILPRCHVPHADDADGNFSGFGHDEIGISLPLTPPNPPRFVGQVGADRVGGSLYSRAFSNELFTEISALGHADSAPTTDTNLWAQRLIIELKIGRYGLALLHQAVIKAVDTAAKAKQGYLFNSGLVSHYASKPEWTVVHIIGNFFHMRSPPNHEYFDCFDGPISEYRARFSLPLGAEPHETFYTSELAQDW
jgi:hypothetical protein